MTITEMSLQDNFGEKKEMIFRFLKLFKKNVDGKILHLYIRCVYGHWIEQVNISKIFIYSIFEFIC